MSDKMTFDFSGFTQPEVYKKPEPKRRKSRAKTGKTKSPNMYSYGKKNKLVDYKLPFLTPVLRKHITDYYKLAVNSTYAHKHKESVRIAESVIYEYITENDNEVKDILTYANQVRHTMSHKGWNLTFKGKMANVSNYKIGYITEDIQFDISISIMCMFKPNYRSKYIIIANWDDKRFNLFNDIVECEKTILAFPDDIPQI